MNSDSPSEPRFVRWTVRALVAFGTLVVVVFCLIGVYAVLAATLLHGSVNERSLFQSVSRVADSAFPDIGGPCKKLREAPDAAWSCAVGDKAGSGFARSCDGDGPQFMLEGDLGCGPVRRWDARDARWLRATGRVVAI